MAPRPRQNATYVAGAAPLGREPAPPRPAPVPHIVQRTYQRPPLDHPAVYLPLAPHPAPPRTAHNNTQRNNNTSQNHV